VAIRSVSLARTHRANSSPAALYRDFSFAWYGQHRAAARPGGRRRPSAVEASAADNWDKSGSLPARFINVCD